MQPVMPFGRASGAPSGSVHRRVNRKSGGRRTPQAVKVRPRALGSPSPGSRYRRSEEHTSELQSPCNLVCRLLLEKKKKIKNNQNKRKSKEREERRITVTIKS